jgi:hypothetical protein
MPAQPEAGPQQQQPTANLSSTEQNNASASGHKSYYQQSKAEIGASLSRIDNWITDAKHLQRFQVLFDGMVALFTFLLWRTTRRQWKVANDSLALSTRPQIKLRGFFIINDLVGGGPDDRWIIEIGYEVVNYGGTDAFVTASNCTIWMNRLQEPPTLPLKPPYDISDLESRIVRRGQSFTAGNRYALSRKATVNAEDRNRLGNNVPAGYFTVHILGFINYTGIDGTRRYRTAFCRKLTRKYHIVPDKFEVVIDPPDYEYED